MAGSDHCCKVARTVEKHDLAGFDERLVEAYTVHGASLRQLEGLLRATLVRTALEDDPEFAVEGSGPLEGGGSPPVGGVDGGDGTSFVVVGSRAVPFDDVVDVFDYDRERDEGSLSPGERRRLETLLDQQLSAELDDLRDELRADFVSYRTIATHLNDHLGVDTSRETTITRETAESRYQWAVNRCRGILSDAVSQLDNAGLVSVGNVEVKLVPWFECTECHRSMTFGELLEEGCACSDPDG